MKKRKIGLFPFFRFNNPLLQERIFKQIVTQIYEKFFKG